MNIRSLFFLLLPLPLLAVKAFNGNKDFQVWVQDSVRTNICGRLYARGEQEFRFTEDSSKLYYQHNQISFPFLASKHFELEPIYRQTFVRRKNQPDNWQPHYVPMLDLTLKVVSKGGWKIRDRNRVMYVIQSGPAKSHWVYRNMFFVMTPFYYYFKAIVPIAFDEVFFREYEGLSQNRIAGGVQIAMIGSLKGNFVYMYRSLKKDTGWVHQNVLFGAIRFNF